MLARGPHRARAAIAAAALVLMAGCGSGGSQAPTPTGTGSAPEPAATAPSGLAEAVWPSGSAAVRGALSRLPPTFDGALAIGLDAYSEDGSMEVAYYNGGRLGNDPIVRAQPLVAGSTGAQGVVELWRDTGCPARCDDWASSPVLAVLGTVVDAGSPDVLRAEEAVATDVQDLWFSTTVTRDRDWAPLPLNAQRHLLAFATNGWVWSIAAPDDETRDRLLSILLHALPGPPATWSPSPSSDYEECFCPPEDIAETNRIAAALPWAHRGTARDPEGCALSFAVRASRAAVTADLEKALRAAGYGERVHVEVSDYESRAWGENSYGRWMDLLIRDDEITRGVVQVTILLDDVPAGVVAPTLGTDWDCCC